MHSGYYHFEDGPARPYDGTNAITWHAACFLVETGFNTVTIRDGVYWGWNTTGTTPSDGGGGTDKGYRDKGEVQAVPEPPTLVVLLPLAAFARRRRAR